jgi:hypothetical protein
VFVGAVRLVKDQIAAFFEVDARTIERYLEKHSSLAYYDVAGRKGS